MVQVKSFNARDDESIRHLIHRSNLVINLIGIQKETMNWSFQETHIDIAAKIAQACKESELVERFWHVGCLGADKTSTSRRLQSKVELQARHYLSRQTDLPCFSLSCVQYVLLTTFLGFKSTLGAIASADAVTLQILRLLQQSCLHCISFMQTCTLHSATNNSEFMLCCCSLKGRRL